MGRVKLSVVVLTILASAFLGACAETPDAKRARHLSRGDEYFGQGRYKDALIEYQNVLRFNASDSRAIERMGFAYHNLGDFRRAYPFLLKARQANPDDVNVTMKLAAIYLLAGKLDEARELAGGILEKDPNHLEALQVMAVAARRQNEIAEAAAGFEAARPVLEARAGYHISLAELSLKTRDFTKAEAQLKEALNRDEKSVQAHLLLANLYRAKGDRDSALAEFKTAVAIEPVVGGARLNLVDFHAANRDFNAAKEVLRSSKESEGDYLATRRRLSELAFIEGKTDESLAILADIFKKAPSDVEGHLIRGRIYLTKRQTTEAIQDFQGVLKADSKHAQARYWLAIAYHQTGNIQQAKTELTQALVLAPAMTDAAFLLAQMNLESANPAAVIESMEKIIAAQPKALQAYLLLGTAQLSRQQPAAALQTFKKMQAIAPKDPRPVHLTGIALQAVGQKAEATKEFERALSMKATFTDPLTALVGQAIGEGNTGLALERIRKQISVAGDSTRLQFLLGSTHQLRKENAQAEAAYAKALQLDQTFVPAYVALGQMYLAAQDDQKALAKFEQALSVNGNDVVSRMMIAQIHLNRGDRDKAKESYEQILAAKPRFVPAANNLAWILAQNGDKERALQLATIAKEGSPDDPFVSDTLGWILHQRGVNERAWTLIKESAAKQPGNPEIQYHAGVLAQKMGQPELAKQHFQRVVASGNNYSNKDKAVKALSEIK